MKTWNETCAKTYALKFSSKMLTDEIMHHIEKKTGVGKKQQRTADQSKQLTTQETFNLFNIQESDPIDPQKWTRDNYNRPNTTILRPPKRIQSNEEHQKQESAYPNQQTWTA